MSGGCLDIFSLVYHFSFPSPSLWETTRYRLKYCLKGPLNPKQPTNQIPIPNIKRFSYLSDYECHRTLHCSLYLYENQRSFYDLLIPYLKSRYSNKWPFGCYAIKNVSLNTLETRKRIIGKQCRPGSDAT